MILNKNLSVNLAVNLAVSLVESFKMDAAIELSRKFTVKANRLLILLLLSCYSMVLQANEMQSDTRANASCLVGLKHYILPLIKDTRNEQRTLATHNQAQVASAATAYAIVDEVLKSEAQDVFLTIETLAAQYKTGAILKWNSFENSRERIQEITNTCQSMRAVQLDLIEKLQATGYFDDTVKTESVLTLRQLIGAAVHNLEPA